MGLTAAYRLGKLGYRVTVLEADDRLGGMSALCDLGGLEIERYYHFYCKPDAPLFELLKELDLFHLLKWHETKMGFFYEGKLYKWGTPFRLLAFPKLGMLGKLRFGLQAFLSIKRDRWDSLEGRTAIDWIKGMCGEEAYRVLWDSLMRLKFHKYRENISASWFWRRLRRVGRSRRNMFTESLSYLEGGVKHLLDALERNILERGGDVRVSSPVSLVVIDGDSNRVTGVEVNGEIYPFDIVLSTVPLVYLPRLAPGLPERRLEQYRKLINIGVVCVVLKMKHRLTRNFWLNISDSRADLPGIIEYSNLNPLHERVAYFPFYLPHTHESFSRSDEEFLENVKGICRLINPGFHEDWVLASRVHRYEYAQPVCPPGFLEMLPPVRTGVEGFYAVDTSYYYPEDRAIPGSILEAQKTVELIREDDEKKRGKEKGTGKMREKKRGQAR